MPRKNKRKDPRDRFWPKVEKTESCWNWIGCIDNLGYGKFSFNRKTIRAHRFIFILLNIEIPKILCVDHLCGNRKCVNPEHLELVSPKTNSLRSFSPPAMNSRKTFCNFGHEYNESNTYLRPDGRRGCHQCRQAYNLTYYEYHREKFLLKLKNKRMATGLKIA